MEIKLLNIRVVHKGEALPINGGWLFILMSNPQTQGFTASKNNFLFLTIPSIQTSNTHFPTLLPLLPKFQHASSPLISQKKNPAPPVPNPHTRYYPSSSKSQISMWIWSPIPIFESFSHFVPSNQHQCSRQLSLKYVLRHPVNQIVSTFKKINQKVLLGSFGLEMVPWIVIRPTQRTL